MRIGLTVLIISFPSLLVAQTPERLSQVRDSYPELSPDGGQIVFQSNRDGSNQVWIMSREGGEVRQLTRLPGSAETPTWSPDGTRIAFVGYPAEGNTDVFVMDADGNNIRQITHGAGNDDHPHWTRDGRRIVFNSDRDTPDPEVPWERRWHDIWSVEVESGSLVKHTDCRTVCTYGSLSPDGRHVLYRRVDDSDGLNWWHEAGPRNSEVYVARADGSDPRPLAPHPAFDGWPAWSPDGEWVVFASNRGERILSGQLWRVRPDGSDLEQLTSGDWGHVQPRWAADSKAMTAFQYQENEQLEHGGIAVLELD